MALYRQVAGIPGTGSTGQVGLLSTFDLIERATRDLIDPTPVYYQPADEYVNPNPLQTTDTGGSTDIRDPRDFNPDTITLPPSPLPDVTPIQTVTPSQPLPPSTELSIDTTAITKNFLPLVALAGLTLVAIKGIDLLGDKRKLVYLGGLGLLYYGLSKNKII